MSFNVAPISSSRRLHSAFHVQGGKPTDNPVNESLNGWIREELFMDFHLDDCRTRDAIRDTIERYVDFYNKQRPCYAIGYDTPNSWNVSSGIR